MAYWYRPAYNLTETEIRYAIKNTQSNREAAAFLHISVATYKRYAEKYFDAATGKNLFQLHKNQAGWKKTKPSKQLATIENIFAGMYPNYSIPKLQERLLREGYFEEKCAHCGFCERRISDYTVPLLLTWKDGNRKNHAKENLEFVCYNHYHCYYGDMNRKPFIIIKDKNV